MKIENMFQRFSGISFSFKPNGTVIHDMTTYKAKDVRIYSILKNLEKEKQVFFIWHLS